MIRFPLLAVMVMAPAVSFASEGENRSDIVVTAGGMLGMPQSDYTQSVTVRTDLGEGFGARLENDLRDEAGLIQFRRSDGRSAHPTSQGITMRGLGGSASSRAQVMLDGVPQADPFGGWVAWTAYDAIRMGGVAIRRGGGGIDAPGGLAGTVNLYSSMIDGVDASVAYGSRDGWDATAAIGGPVGSGYVAVDGRYSRGDGFVPIAKGQRGAVDRAAAYEQGGAGLRMRFAAGDNSRIEASVRGFFDRRDRGVDHSSSEIDGVDASLRYVHDPVGATQWLAMSYVQLREFRSGFASVSASRDTVSPALLQNVPATGVGARIEVRPAVNGTNPLRLGMDWRHTEGRTEEGYFFSGLSPQRHRVAGGRSDTVGLFGEWTMGQQDDGFLLSLSGRLDRWWLSTGYRHERNIAGGILTDLTFPARQGWEGSGRVGARWSAGNVALRGAVYRDWRLPTLNELYRPFRVGAETTLANETLTPERLWGGEVGVEWRTEASGLSLTLFANHMDNAIANVTTGPNLNQRQNLDAIKSKGAEVEAHQQLGPVTLRATYSYVDADVSSSGTAAILDGMRPAQVAKHAASVSIRTDRNAPFGGSAILRYTGPQNEDDLGLQKLDDALTLDAGLWWRLSDAMRVEVRGENLFNELVPVSVSASGIVERGTPRTIWAGIRFTL